MIRELKPEEVPLKVGVPDGAIVMGVVEDGKVLALLGAFTTVFLDPFWAAPEYRGRVLTRTVLKQLWEQMRLRLLGANVHAVIGHADVSQPGIAMMLQRIGGVEVPGKRPFIVKLEG